jgi:hypothetical protein
MDEPFVVGGWWFEAASTNHQRRTNNPSLHRHAIRIEH